MIKVFCVTIIWILEFSSVILGFDLQASTTNNGVVTLYEDGTWEWFIQPSEFSGFNDPDEGSNLITPIETVPFDFKNFSSFPVNYVGKWTWIMGEVFMVFEEEEGLIIRIKTRKNLESWIKEYGDVLVVAYNGPEINEGDKIEILVEYRGVGYKYYSSVPVFNYKKESQLKFLE